MSATVTRRPAMAQSHTQHLRHDDVRMAKIKPCQLPVVVVSRTKIERRGELRVRKRPHWGLRPQTTPANGRSGLGNMCGRQAQRVCQR